MRGPRIEPITSPCSRRALRFVLLVRAQGQEPRQQKEVAHPFCVCRASLAQALCVRQVRAILGPLSRRRVGPEAAGVQGRQVHQGSQGEKKEEAAETGNRKVMQKTRVLQLALLVTVVAPGDVKAWVEIAYYLAGLLVAPFCPAKGLAVAVDGTSLLLRVELNPTSSDHSALHLAEALPLELVHRGVVHLGVVPEPRSVSDDLKKKKIIIRCHHAFATSEVVSALRAWQTGAIGNMCVCV